MIFLFHAEEKSFLKNYIPFLLYSPLFEILFCYFSSLYFLLSTVRFLAKENYGFCWVLFIIFASLLR